MYSNYPYTYIEIGDDLHTPTSDELKLMRKAYRKYGGLEIRWYETWSNGKGVKEKLFFEYTFTTQAKASSFLGDLLMGIRNHSDLIAVEITDDYIKYIDLNKFGHITGDFETLKERCVDMKLEPEDFKLQKVDHLQFVVNEDS